MSFSQNRYYYSLKKENGKCYTESRPHIDTKIVTSQILVKPTYTTIEVIPPIFKIIEEKILLSEILRKSEQSLDDSTLLKIETMPEHTKFSVSPVRFDTIIDRIQISPPRGTWYMVRKDSSVSDCFRMSLLSKMEKHIDEKTQNCISEDCFIEGVPKDYWIIGREESPTQFKTIKKLRLKSPEKIEKVKIPAEHELITKDWIEKKINNQSDKYIFVRRKVLIEPSRYIERQVSAEYKTITITSFVDASLENSKILEEVLCPEKINKLLISKIQKSLNVRGYSVDREDGIISYKTAWGMYQYQKEHGLPVGGYNLKTLQLLGISW